MIQMKDGRTLEKGQKVRVYRNLRNGLFSIQDYRSRLVCGYSDSFVLENVCFFISKKAQERARKSNIRNVHAFAIGEFNPSTVMKVGEEITYNPFKDEEFYGKQTKQPIKYIERLFFMEQKIYKVRS